MNFEIVSIPNFDRRVKKLLKKYPFLKSDIGYLAISLGKNPEQGHALGNNSYKLRNGNWLQRKREIWGRVVTYLQVTATRVYLLSIYDKSEKETISDKEIIEPMH